MLQRNSKIRTRKGFCRKLFIFNIWATKAQTRQELSPKNQKGDNEKKTPEQACSAVSVVAVLRPSSEDSLGETPQYIEYYQLHSHHQFMFITGSLDSPSAAVITHSYCLTLTCRNARFIGSPGSADFLFV